MSLYKESGLHIGPSALFRRESPMKTMHRFFLAEEVLMLSVVQLDYGDSSKSEEPSFPTLSSCTCRALYLFCKGS